MEFDFDTLPHAGIRSLCPYIPGKSIEEVASEFGLTDIIKLASNENVWGCSAKVTQALNSISSQDIALYPNSITNPFRKKLADFLDIDVNQLLLSNGSDAIMGLLLTCFALHTDKHVITHDYAFSIYKVQSNTDAIPIRSIPTKNWTVDIDAMINACNDKTVLMFIANPNNPTGLLINHQDIARLLESIPKTTILVLDEAYYEYASSTYYENSLSLLKKHRNLVITRTFSKAYGLAGLRIGYAIADPQIIKLLYTIQLPFAVNSLAMLAASAAIDDQAFIEHTVKQTKEGMLQMQKGLALLNIQHLPTEANFITLDCGTDGTHIFHELQTYGIIVRPLSAYGMNNYLRVTIGTKEQNIRFLDTLRVICCSK